MPTKTFGWNSERGIPPTVEQTVSLRMKAITHYGYIFSPIKCICKQHPWIIRLLGHKRRPKLVSASIRTWSGDLILGVNTVYIVFFLFFIVIYLVVKGLMCAFFSCTSTNGTKVS